MNEGQTRLLIGTKLERLPFDLQGWGHLGIGEASNCSHCCAWRSMVCIAVRGIEALLQRPLQTTSHP